MAQTHTQTSRMCLFVLDIFPRDQRSHCRLCICSACRINLEKGMTLCNRSRTGSLNDGTLPQAEILKFGFPENFATQLAYR